MFTLLHNRKVETERKFVCVLCKEKTAQVGIVTIVHEASEAREKHLSEAEILIARDRLNGLNETELVDHYKSVSTALALDLGLCMPCIHDMMQVVGKSVGVHGFLDLGKVLHSLALPYWKGAAIGATASIDDYFEENKNLAAEVYNLEKELNQAKKELSQQLDKVESLKQSLQRNTTHNGTSGHVYLMRRPSDGFYKIGLSSNVENRLKTIQRDFPDTELIHTIETDNMAVAEADLHERFAEVRQGNTEWFNLSPDDVKYITALDRYELHTKPGRFLKESPTFSVHGNDEPPNKAIEKARSAIRQNGA